MSRLGSIPTLIGTLALAAALVCPSAVAQSTSRPDSDAPAVKALMITGGCCHDYQNQKRLISEGLSARVGPIDWTILEYGSGRDVKADVYRQADWIDGYDIVIHNECFGAVTDGEFVKGIVQAHVDHGVPAIVIHCSMHSYREAPTAETWRAFLGVTSRRHEKSKHSLLVKPTDAGRSSKILAAVGDSWETPNGELYLIEKVWPTTTVLAEVHSEETNRQEPVIWTNQYHGVRVFGISLGHHNETVESDVWQNVVAAGWRWSLER